MADERFTIVKRGSGVSEQGHGTSPAGVGEKYDAILAGGGDGDEQPNPVRAAGIGTPSVDALDRVKAGRRVDPDGKTAAEYNDMSWGEYAPILASNIVPSSWEAIKGVASAVMHPVDTATAVGKLGYGFASKGADAASSALGYGPVLDPSTKGEREAVADAMLQSYKSRYGGGEEGEFWKHLAEDPASYLTDIASVASAGAGTATKLGLIDKAGKIAKGANAVSMIDPMQAAIKTAGAVVPKVGEAVPAILARSQNIASGVPYEYLRGIYRLGKEGSPEQINAFVREMRGNPQFSGNIADALDAARLELGTQASANYMRNASPALARRTEVDMSGSIDALDDIKGMLNPSSMVARRAYFPGDDYTKAATAVNLVSKYASHGSPRARTIKELDGLKKEVDRIANDISDHALKTRVQALAGNLVQDMGRVDPAYLDMMKDWSRYKDISNNIRRDMGSDSLSDAQRSRKAAKAAASPDAEAMFSALEQTPTGKNLRPALYGRAVNPWMSDASHTLVAGIGGPLAFQYLEHPALKFGAVAGAASTSPRLAGLTQQNLGRVVNATNKTADITARYGLNPITTNAANQLASAMYPLGEPVEDRTERKSGGRVSAHEADADQLVRAAERAKKGWSAKTEPLLNQSDETVVKALEVANRSI